MGSIAGPLASAAVQYGASKLFGSNKSTNAIPPELRARLNAAPLGLNTSGFIANTAGGNVNVGVTPIRQAAINNLSRTFSNTSNRLGALREQVAPGFGRLTNARVKAVQDARRRAIGNLEDNLARRRLSGSSFATDALSRAEAEFGREEAQVRAQSFLEELDVTTQLIQRQGALDTQAVNTYLQEFNLQADIGLQLSRQAQETINGNTRLLSGLSAAQAKLNAEENAASGKFIGRLTKPIADSVGDAIEGLFE